MAKLLKKSAASGVKQPSSERHLEVVSAEPDELEEEAADLADDTEDNDEELAGDGSDVEAAAVVAEVADVEVEPQVVRTFTAEYDLPTSGFNDIFHAECLALVVVEAAAAGFRVRGGARRSGFTKDGTKAVYVCSVRKLEG